MAESMHSPRTLRVSIASPSDVAEERSALRRLLRDINDVLTFLDPLRNLHLELVGIRAAPPAAVRKNMLDTSGHEVLINTSSAKFSELAKEYETTRSTMPSGWARTRRMAAVFAQMKTAAPDGQALLDEFIESPSPGTRLGAIAILQMFPREQHVDWLATRLDNPDLEAPFVGYQAAVALVEAVRALPRDSCLNLKTSFEKAKTLASKLPKDSDRLTVLKSAEAELARKCSDAPTLPSNGGSNLPAQ